MRQLTSPPPQFTLHLKAAKKHPCPEANPDHPSPISIHKISGDSRLTDIVMDLEYVLRSADEGSVENYGEDAQDARAKSALRRMISRVKPKFPVVDTMDWRFIFNH